MKMRKRQQEQEQETSWNFLPKQTPKRWTWTLEDPSTWIDDGQEKPEADQE